VFFHVGEVPLAVDLAATVAWLESHVDELDDTLRTAWTKLLTTIAGTTSVELRFWRDTLVRIADSVDDPARLDWHELGARLRRHSSDHVLLTAPR
jgi:hypothetical protein